jgi:CHAT domain-containing protein
MFFPDSFRPEYRAGSVWRRPRQQVMRGVRQAFHKGLPPEVARLFDKLNAASRELANQSRIVPRPGTEAVYRQKQADLSESIERFQRELAAKSDEFRKQRQQQRRTADDIRQALPSDAALVDLLEYQHVAPSEQRGKRPSFERRLVAFVVRPDRPVERIELGPPATIAGFIEQWRTNYGAASAEANVDPGQELRRLVWAKLEPHLQGAKTILFSPDGATARFPWAALPGKTPGTYLLEERAVAVVPVPRLLPELLADDNFDQSGSASLLLVGGVDFGADPGRIVDVALDRGAARGDAMETWQPLPGTVAEVAAVKAAFAQHFSQVAPLELTGAAATKNAVRDEMSKCRYLHFSTHGFFAAPKVKSATSLDAQQNSTAMGSLVTRQDVSGYHPDLLSGLVLAGANRQAADGQEDGILTALEVSGLDLSRVELATLSACETGLGESAGGEGLLGLQRAFQLAGAKTTVSSLWQVPDKATRSLMQRFYENLWNRDRKMSKLEALREAQLWLLNHAAGHPELIRGLELEATAADDAHAGRLSPRYWAAFELSGNWR